MILRNSSTEKVVHSIQTHDFHGTVTILPGEEIEVKNSAGTQLKRLFEFLEIINYAEAFVVPQLSDEDKKKLAEDAKNVKAEKAVKGFATKLQDADVEVSLDIPAPPKKKVKKVVLGTFKNKKKNN